MKSSSKLKLAASSPFKIESGIPVPSRIKPNPYEGVFSKMKVGESFLINGDAEPSKVSYYAGKYRQEHKGVKFAFRLTNDGSRCWRVE